MVFPESEAYSDSVMVMLHRELECLGRGIYLSTNLDMNLPAKDEVDDLANYGDVVVVDESHRTRRLDLSDLLPHSGCQLLS
jgi:hypothetical protein